MTPDEQKQLEKIQAVVATVEAALEADLLIYNGTLNEDDVETTIQTVIGRRRRKNVLLILTTYGGDPDSAYMLARTLHRSYERFIAYVPGYCKSAGTLVVIGAHELILSAHAQLGPLDIQVSHTDEIGQRRSGLAPSEALRVL